MIHIDIDKPKTCAECLMSCRDSFYEIYCRNDMKKHKPFDKDCPLKEVPTGKWIPQTKDKQVWQCSVCGYSMGEINGIKKGMKALAEMVIAAANLDEKEKEK